MDKFTSKSIKKAKLEFYRGMSLKRSDKEGSVDAFRNSVSEISKLLQTDENFLLT
jgi:hypothetical protein